MKLDRAEMTIEGGRIAVYFDSFVETDWPGNAPALIVQVEDFDEAKAIIDTLERSAARKKKDPPAATAAAPATPPTGTVARGQEVAPNSKCIAPGCEYDADFKADTCVGHSARSEEEKAAWRRGNEVTPPPVGRKKARQIREQLEGAHPDEAAGPKVA